MISYPFIEALFGNILGRSSAIQGRFLISTNNGQEINSDTLNQVLNDTVTQNTDTVKYPLAIMMPPRSQGKVGYSQVEWESYRIVMFFLKTTFYDGNNQITDVNPNTQTSTRPVIQHWEDMKICAQDFIRVLDWTQSARQTVKNLFRMPYEPRLFTPVSNVGNDRLSGQRVDFSVELFTGCEITDYPADSLMNISIPL